MDSGAEMSCLSQGGFEKLVESGHDLMVRILDRSTQLLRSQRRWWHGFGQNNLVHKKGGAEQVGIWELCDIV